MPGAHVQNVGGSDFNTTVTVAITVSAGGSILAFWDIGVVDPTSVVSDVDGALTVVTGIGSGGRVAGIGYLLNATPGTHNITLTVASAAGLTMGVSEFSGLTTFDQITAFTESFTGVPVTDSLTPIAVNQHAVAVMFNSSGGAILFGSWTNGFTERSDSNYAGACQLALADLVVPSTSSLNAGATTSFGDNTARVLMLFNTAAPANKSWYYQQHQGGD